MSNQTEQQEAREFIKSRQDDEICLCHRKLESKEQSIAFVDDLYRKGASLVEINRDRELIITFDQERDCYYRDRAEVLELLIPFKPDACLISDEQIVVWWD